MRSDDDIDKELARLRDATESVLPRPGFSDNVMQAVHSEQPPAFYRAMGRSGQKFFPFAVVLAMASILWAAHLDNALEDTLAISHEAMELEW